METESIFQDLCSVQREKNATIKEAFKILFIHEMRELKKRWYKVKPKPTQKRDKK